MDQNCKEQFCNRYCFKNKIKKWHLKNWGFYYEKSSTIEIKRFFGITLFKKRIIGKTEIRTTLLGLLKIKNTPDYKKVYLCGIQIKSKEKPLKISELNEIINVSKHQIAHKIVLKVQQQLTIAQLHQKTFSEYKNIHRSETVFLVGAGATLNDFSYFNRNAYYIALNRSFLFEKINFNYLFSNDFAGIETYCKELIEYKGNNCIKFLGDLPHGKEWQIPEQVRVNANARKFYTTEGLYKPRFAVDIDTEPLGQFHSIAFPAMQFALYTNPSKIYLVGIDCTPSGHFIGDNQKVLARGTNCDVVSNIMINIAWPNLKTFAQRHYPETQIIAVNPIGLKGIFREVYTKSYLQKHPEIDPNAVEILETSIENKKEELNV